MYIINLFYLEIQKSESIINLIDWQMNIIELMIDRQINIFYIKKVFLILNPSIKIKVWLTM